MNGIMSTGFRQMAPLMFCRDSSPAEALHPSQDDISQGAHRTGQGKSGVWFLASWNVRTLSGMAGPCGTHA